MAYYHNNECAYQVKIENGEIGWNGEKNLLHIFEHDFSKFILDVARLKFPNPFGLRSLDIGCGTGPVALALARYGFITSGIDISKSAIEIAKTLAREVGVPIHYQRGDILEIHDFETKFDVVADSRCLHCLVFDNHRETSLKNIRKLT